jgi:hypothetical protein
MTWLTIEEAKQLTSKSDTTIRRLIKRLVQNDNAMTRQKITQQPQKHGGSFNYLIDKAYLLEKIGLSEGISTTTQPPMQTATEQLLAKTLEALTKQLEEKDQQIRNRDQEIKRLHEAREDDRKLMFQAYEQVRLLQAPKEKVVASERSGQEQNSHKKPKQKKEKPASPPEKKKGLFSWFRK